MKKALLFSLWVVFCLFWVIAVPMIAIKLNSAWGLLVMAIWASVLFYILRDDSEFIDLDGSY